MKRCPGSALLMLSLLLLAPAAARAQADDAYRLHENKPIARDFYGDLWFSDKTDNYGRYVADTYVVHDIGDQKGVTEPAMEQKNIADFFWDNGTLSGSIALGESLISQRPYRSLSYPCCTSKVLPKCCRV